MARGPCRSVRTLALAFAFALALALALCAPRSALATEVGDCERDPAMGRACVSETADGPDCGRDAAVVQVGRVGASASGENYCDDAGTTGTLVSVSVADGEGRESVEWESFSTPEGDYRAIHVERAPRVVDWYADESGCTIRYAFFPVIDASQMDCPAGAPPEPPAVAWGHLLP